jgi:hypothetical protein
VAAAHGPDAINVNREEVKSMERKAYESPELIRHGDVEKITLQGGGAQTDVPIGTPSPGNINDITS